MLDQGARSVDQQAAAATPSGDVGSLQHPPLTEHAPPPPANDGGDTTAWVPRTIQEHRSHVSDLMIFACPWCSMPFFDFTDCAAIACECGNEFCGLCLARCDIDESHRHVLHCAANPTDSVDVPSEALLQVHTAQRRRRLLDYLKQETYTLERCRDILAACAVELDGFGIRITEDELQALHADSADVSAAVASLT